MSDPDVRASRWLGVGFTACFLVSLTALLGDQIGAFADSAATFTYSDTSAERLRHAAGAYVLTASGLLFIGFAVRASAAFGSAGRQRDGRTARLAAAGFGTLIGLAAAALSTVSLSIGFGQITGDPGIRQGQELLPQLGYVLIFVPGALFGGMTILHLARGAAATRQLPRWMVAGAYLAASAQLFSFYTLPLLLLPLWVLLAAITLRPAPASGTSRQPAAS